MTPRKPNSAVENRNYHQKRTEYTLSIVFLKSHEKERLNFKTSAKLFQKKKSSF